jgi:hypothetical protein
MKAAITAMLAGVGLIGCSGCDREMPEGSGWIRSPPMEAARDASPDAMDAALDHAAPRDAGDSDHHAISEAGGTGGWAGDASVVDEGDWIRSPFSDLLGCTVEQPKDLSSVTRASWLPCEGSQTPCQLLDTAYLPGSYSMKLAFLAPVSHSNALRLAVVRGVGSVIRSPTAYASTGDPVAAWRFADDQHCALFVFWVAAGAAGIVLSPTDAVRSPTGIMQTVMVGSPAQLLAGQGERYDLLLNLTNMNGVDHMSFSDTIVVADGQPGGRL